MYNEGGRSDHRSDDEGSGVSHKRARASLVSAPPVASSEAGLRPASTSPRLSMPAEWRYDAWRQQVQRSAVASLDERLDVLERAARPMSATSFRAFTFALPPVVMAAIAALAR